MDMLEKYLFGKPDENRDKTVIFEAIAKLPVDNKNVINLHFIQAKKRKQIASDLGWSLSKVNQKITRGITLLKLELNPDYFNQMRAIISVSSYNASEQP